MSYESHSIRKQIIGFLMNAIVIYESQVRFRIRMRDSAIFEKVGCGNYKNSKNIFIYIFNILLCIHFHIKLTTISK